MFKNIKKLYFIIGVEKRKKIKILMLAMIITAFVDIAALGSVMPFVSVLMDPEKIITNQYFKNITNNKSYCIRKSIPRWGYMQIKN